MSRIQLKIMGALALLIMLVVGASGILAERGLRARAIDSIRNNLEQQSRLVAQLVEAVPFDVSQAAELQARARSAATATESRITLVDPSGRVLADSEVPENQVASLSNHADRPEIVDALSTGAGDSIRHSYTLKRSLVYTAIRIPADLSLPPIGVARLALYLDQVDAASAQLRTELIVAGIVGLLGALGLSYALSAFSLRPIRELRDVVSDIAAGKLDRRLRWDTHDERVEIAASINQMSRQMRSAVEEALSEKIQLKAVLESMVEGVVVIDRDRKLILVNPRGREMLSVWGDYEGRMVPEVIRSPEVDRALQDAANSDEIVVREIEVQTEKTRILLMHASGFPHTDPRAGTVVVFSRRDRVASSRSGEA